MLKVLVDAINHELMFPIVVHLDPDAEVDG